MAANARVDGPDPIDVEVGINLRRIRKQRGVSQSEMGRSLGITFQQIQKYEKGTNRISASMLVRAAKAMGVQPADLLPTTDARPLPPSASLLSLRGAEDLLEGFAAIKSSRHPRAVLTLVKALREVDGAPAASGQDDEGAKDG